VVNPGPVGPAAKPADQPAPASQSGPGLSQEDVNALQDMIMKSDVDIE
jgi:hypothetical protein